MEDLPFRHKPAWIDSAEAGALAEREYSFRDAFNASLRATLIRGCRDAMFASPFYEIFQLRFKAASYVRQRADYAEPLHFDYSTILRSAEGRYA